MKVKILCWDGVEYYRETDEKEIDKYKEQGYVQWENDEIIFNFRDTTTKQIKEIITNTPSYKSKDALFDMGGSYIPGVETHSCITLTGENMPASSIPLTEKTQSFCSCEKEDKVENNKGFNYCYKFNSENNNYYRYKSSNQLLTVTIDKSNSVKFIISNNDTARDISMDKADLQSLIDFLSFQNDEEEFHKGRS